MALRLTNTLTRSVQDFEPLEPGKARVYACGPTIYNNAHIGNFRSFIVYDLLHRYLEWSGYDVQFVMNLTDVDDKTIEAAAQASVSVAEYTRPFGDTILADARTLGIRPADSYPRATEYVDPMVEFVERLEKKGLAYPTDDGVYFRISAFPGYGKLKGLDPDSLQSGARVAEDEYEKDDVRDFVLWKGAKPIDEETGAAWDSPWGRGRPGWHLECSVMAVTELGETVDIHLGGEDLVFPHHENEIAQSEGATGRPFVRHWVHVKHLILEGRKMSKSLGNSITVRELLEQGYDPVAIRHQLLSAQYRSELNFTTDGLGASAQAVQRLLDFQARLEAATDDPAAAATRIPELSTAMVDGFREAMDDDLNSAEALAALFVFVKDVNAELDRSGDRVLPADRSGALAALGSVDEVLGLIETARQGAAVDEETVAWIEERIVARRTAREAREWAAADAIRDELADRGIVLEDGAQGTRWKRVLSADTVG
jgi:cysteinyl-tRNA synthetase